MWGARPEIRAPLKRTFAGGGPQERGNQLEQGRFAGPVRSDHRQDLTRADGKDTLLTAISPPNRFVRCEICSRSSMLLAFHPLRQAKAEQSVRQDQHEGDEHGGEDQQLNCPVWNRRSQPK